MIKRVAQSFKINNSSIMQQINSLEVQAAKAGIGSTTKKDADSYATTAKGISYLWQANTDGCDECNHTGYRGRMGIYEVLENNVDIQKLIVANGTSDVIQNQAIKDGMITMQLDGLIKALRGQTTIEEILRVTAED
jgi:type IV pilus assembly protein PilB